MTATICLGARVVAIAIAIAAFVDPVWSTSRPPLRTLVAIDLSSGGDAAIDRLRHRDTGWSVVARPSSGPMLPCAPGEHCVLVSDGSIDTGIPADLTHPLSLIVERSTREPNIELRNAVMSTSHGAAAAVARVQLLRTGSVPVTEIRVIDHGAVIGSATHKWDKETSASVDVPWWPIGDGARALRIEAVPAGGESTTIDNQIDVGVDVLNTRATVLVFDARPSWSSTFVRRALEDDPRFTVGHRARIAPALTAGTTNARLDSQVLDATDVLVIGGPEAITDTDVELIDRFVRVRGGTLVLLPEQNLAGPARRFVAGDWSEHLTQTPERVGPLYATEIIRGTGGALSSALASSGSQAAIVSTPLGQGRIIMSGAMDAWRHRDKDANAFDRFWRSVVAEGAAAAASPSLTLDRSLSQPAATISFMLRDRRMFPLQSADASATIRCADRPAASIRLWPAGSIGEFTGAASVTAGPCTIEAVINDRQVSASFAVAERPHRGTDAVITKLERVARESGGTIVAAGDEATLLSAIGNERQDSSQVVSLRPMRAAWWIVPFAGCLTLEWWLRRREGLR